MKRRWWSALEIVLPSGAIRSFWKKSEVDDLNQLLAAKPEWMSPDGVPPSKGGTRLIEQMVGEKVKPLLGR
jgi:hypothetical protein